MQYKTQIKARLNVCFISYFLSLGAYYRYENGILTLTMYSDIAASQHLINKVVNMIDYDNKIENRLLTVNISLESSD